jgi:hypothetical protein
MTVYYNTDIIIEEIKKSRGVCEIFSANKKF